MKKKIKIKFVDFYPNFDPQEVSLWSWLWERYDVVLSDEPEWLVYSVFGNEHLRYNNCVKLFYTGENQVPDFNLCDYAFGFEYLELGDRYMRLPLWLNYSKDVEAMLHKQECPNLTEKTDFCSFVVSNPHGNEARAQFMDELSKYKTVHSGGRWRNNVGGPVADKMAFQKTHKFSIAFENACHPGYTTEKIVQSFAAQTIPIYWGDPRVAETFNTDAFINCNDYPNWESVIERVKEIDQNDALWQKMMEAPALKDPQIVERMRQEAKDFLYHIFDQEPETAKRFSRDYWTLKKLKERQREVKAYQRSCRGLSESFYMEHLYPFVRKHAWLWNGVQSCKRVLHLA